MGLKSTAWRNAARSALVAADRMALAAVTLGGARGASIFLPRLSEGLAGAPIAGHSLTDVRLGERDGRFGANGMDQRRLEKLRRPLMITVPSFTMWTWYLEKRARQSSSQSLPMERREPVARPSSTFPLLAVVDSCGARGIWAVWVVFIEFPSAAVTIGPVEEGWRLLQWALSVGVR